MAQEGVLVLTLPALVTEKRLAALRLVLIFGISVPFPVHFTSSPNLTYSLQRGVSRIERFRPSIRLEPSDCEMSCTSATNLRNQGPPQFGMGHLTAAERNRELNTLPLA